MWTTCETVPPISWMGLCAMSAAKLSDAPGWQRPQVFFLFSGLTGEVGSVFETIACAPPSARDFSWQFAQDGA